jgi:hypothetical protein
MVMAKSVGVAAVTSDGAASEVRLDESRMPLVTRHWVTATVGWLISR